MNGQTIKAAAFLILAAALPSFGQTAMNNQAHRDSFARVLKEHMVESGQNVNVWAVGTNLHIYDIRANTVLAYKYHTNMFTPMWPMLKKYGFTSVSLVDGEYGYRHTWDLAKPKAGSFWRSADDDAAAEDKAVTEDKAVDEANAAAYKAETEKMEAK